MVTYHMKRQSGILPSHLIVRILALYMMSILSYLLFDGLFSAFIFYGASGLPTWIVIVLILFLRAGFAELVSDKIMEIRGQLLLNNLISVAIALPMGIGLYWFVRQIFISNSRELEIYLPHSYFFLTYSFFVIFFLL